MINNLKDLKERNIITGLESDSFSKLHFVKAGAGAGKTSSIKERVLNLIKTKELKPERLVLITYTTKAANELITRIRDVIEQELQNPKLVSKERDKLVFALSTLSHGKISTFHSFCYDLLREYPIEFKVDSDAEIGDERGQETIYQKCFDKLSEEAQTTIDFTNKEGLKIFLELSESTKHEDILNFLIKLYENRDLKAQSINLSEFNQDALKTSFEGFVEELIEIYTQIPANLTKPDDKMEKSYNQVILPIVERFRFDGDLDFYGLTDLLLSRNYSVFKSVGTATNYKSGFLKKLKDKIKEVNNSFEQYQAVGNVDSYNKSIQVFDYFEKIVTKYKKDHGILDFFDCLYKVTTGLKSNSELLKIVQKRFDVIVVDEFQDSDPMQAEIAFLLGDDDLTKLFFVGDPKQSIYGFARADIAVYQSVMDKVQALPTGSVLSLTTNFRSHPEVLKFVNSNFKTILGRDKNFPEITVDYEEMAVDPSKNDKSSKVSRWKLESKLSEELKIPPAEIKREREAFMVASEINKLVKSKQYNYGDFLILFRTGTSMADYEDALNLLQIPVINTKSKDFLKKSEVLDLLNIISYIAIPKDKYLKSCAFNSPLIKSLNLELVEDIVNSEESVINRTRHLLKLIGLTECSLQNSSDHLIQLATNLLSLFLVELEITNFNINESLANLYEKATNDSFINSVKLNDEKIYIEAKNLNAVKLMTIHSSKGLESRVVILSCLGRRKSQGRNSFIDRATKTFYPENSLINDASVKILNLTQISSKNDYQDKKTEEEEKRVMYVAVTRAIEHLIVLDDEERNSFLSILVNDQTKFSEEVLFKFEDYLGKFSEFGLFKETKFGTIPQNQVCDSIQCLYENKNISKAVTVLIENKEIFKNNEGRKHGMEFGILTHKIFEVLSMSLFHSKSKKIDVSKIVDHFVQESDVKFEREDLGELLVKAQEFLNSRLAEEIMTADDVQTEIPFEFKENYHGIIDLLIAMGDMISVVDFKSDQLKVNGVEIKEHYKKQINFYTKALSEISGKEVKGECFYIFE